MSSTISPDLYSLIGKAINSLIEEFSLEVSENIIGEGFSGDVIFVTLTNNKSKEKQYLAVKQQKSGEKGTSIQSTLPFINEIYFYETIWRKLEQFYYETTNKRLRLVPKCLGTSQTGTKRLILENLKSQGFKTSEKTKPFDSDQLELAFKTYGIFHGVSLAYRENNQEEFVQWANSIQFEWKKLFSKGSSISQALVYSMTNGEKLFDEQTEKHLVEKLREYKENGPDILYNLLNQSTVQPVINHGDCWSNNMMFKYDVSQTFITN